MPQSHTISCKVSHPFGTRIHVPLVGHAFCDSITLFTSFHLSSCCPSRHAHLVICGTAHWEFEAAHTACQLPIDFRVCVESVVHATPLLLVQDDLQYLASIFLGSESLANNFNREDNVGEDGVMNSGQGSAAWAFLGLGGAGSVGALGARQNASRREDQNMAV